jgi:tRNA-specific 2-thiouridylase
MGNDGDAWYVARKDLASNVLYVVRGHDHPALYSERLRAVDPSWIAGEPPHPHWVYSARIRYRQADVACSLDRVGSQALEVAFSEPQWAVTPGQSVVVYESQVCLGGAVIA